MLLGELFIQRVIDWLLASLHKFFPLQCIEDELPECEENSGVAANVSWINKFMLYFCVLYIIWVIVKTICKLFQLDTEFARSTVTSFINSIQNISFRITLWVYSKPAIFSLVPEGFIEFLALTPSILNYSSFCFCPKPDIFISTKFIEKYTQHI
jgi:hypothetical protein